MSNCGPCSAALAAAAAFACSVLRHVMHMWCMWLHEKIFADLLLCCKSPQPTMHCKDCICLLVAFTADPLLCQHFAVTYYALQSGLVACCDVLCHSSACSCDPSFFTTHMPCHCMHVSLIIPLSCNFPATFLQLSCRGLVLLNIMTFVMGTNWVVLKESNEAFDPVRCCLLSQHLCSDDQAANPAAGSDKSAAGSDDLAADPAAECLY